MRRRTRPSSLSLTISSLSRLKIVGDDSQGISFQSMCRTIALRSLSHPVPCLALRLDVVGEFSLLAKLLQALAADHQAAAVAPAGHQQLLELPARGAPEVALPLAQSLERVVALGIEDQNRQGRLVHEELVDQAIIGLAGEIPEPDLALDVLGALGVRKGQMGCKGTIGRDALPELILGEAIGQAGLAHAAVAHEQDLGVGVARSCFRRQSVQSRQIPLDRHAIDSGGVNPAAIAAPDTLKTAAVWPCKVASQRPLAMSHNRTVLSSDPDTTRRPSPLQDTLKTAAVWPCKVASQRPLAMSHNRTVLSETPTPRGGHRRSRTRSKPRRCGPARWPRNGRWRCPTTAPSCHETPTPRGGHRRSTTRSNRGGVALQGGLATAAGDVPHPHRIVTRPRHHAAAIGAESHTCVPHPYGQGREYRAI